MDGRHKAGRMMSGNPALNNPSLINPSLQRMTSVGNNVSAFNNPRKFAALA